MKAKKYFDEAQVLEAEGRDAEALEKYLAVLELDPTDIASYYNIGLIHKYQNNWLESFKYNQQAYTLDPEHAAARWNLGIAATALRDWVTARRCWQDNGIQLDEGDGPIQCDFGITPVRLNPDGNGEVVWARRIDPARAKIENVPFPESGFCGGDIVLHDGAPVGYRKYGDSERPVFNVLALFEPSSLNTYKAVVSVASQADIDNLVVLLEEEDIHMEDWLMNSRALCKACSEGRPHIQHDQELKMPWVPQHDIGIAAVSEAAVEQVLRQWSDNTRRQVISLECVFAR